MELTLKIRASHYVSCLPPPLQTDLSFGREYTSAVESKQVGE